MPDTVDYFDYAATTPVAPEVLDEMLPYFGPDGDFGNPSSVQHRHGHVASEAVETARKRVALLIGSRPGEIAWTSGATEANNLALRGVLGAAKRPLKLVTAETEHLTVLDVARALRKDGTELEVLPVSSKGLIDLDRLRSMVRRAPSFVSIMWVNNETGVIQPISEIASICKEAGAILHVDAVQAIGKEEVSVKKLPVDLMSVSSHKVYGPKGIGALFVRRGVSMQPLMFGGGQERGLRPGTLPVPQIVGMGKAFHMQLKERAKNAASIDIWHSKVVKFLASLGDIKFNGDHAAKVPHILNVCFGGVSGNLLAALPGVALSTSSACTTQKTMVSHVLRGMGLSKTQAMNSVRISFGKFTTDEQVDRLLQSFEKAVAKLRR